MQLESLVRVLEQDEFEATTRAWHLTWLPMVWPANARLITTTIPGPQSEALAKRSGADIRNLPPLGIGEAEQIAEAICGRYHRQLNPQVLKALLDKRGEDGMPATGNPLWLELAVEALNPPGGRRRGVAEN